MPGPMRPKRKRGLVDKPSKACRQRLKPAATPSKACRQRLKPAATPRNVSVFSKQNCNAGVARRPSPKPGRQRAIPSGTIMAKKLYIETVGCQMNVLDSELVVGTLRRQGYELIHEPTEADVILFNTCSVRQHAEDKIYSALGRLRMHKQRHPSKILGVLGCM